MSFSVPIKDDQRQLSEQLQLLYELRYSDLSLPLSNKAFRDKNSHRELRLLCTIAVALTTGVPGDVFAAAFDKREPEKARLVLAKNGPPTPDDIEAAEQLITLIQSPKVSGPWDIYPFLIQRCRANIVKCIETLHVAIKDIKLTRFLKKRMEGYKPSDTSVEFPILPDDCQNLKDVSFDKLWRKIVGDLIHYTKSGLPTLNPSDTKETFRTIYEYARAIAKSHFFVKVNEGNAEAQRLKRRLDKLCQYVNGIEDLITEAKQLPTISIDWVMDTFANVNTGEHDFELRLDIQDVISRGLENSSGDREMIMDNIIDNDKYSDVARSWRSNRLNKRSRIHAELRIILYLGSPQVVTNLPSHPIGVSKRSCLCCSLWINAYDNLFKTNFLTSGSHGKPYANWALPGAACVNAIGQNEKSSVDVNVLKEILKHLTKALEAFAKGQPSERMRFDEYV